MLVPPWHKKMWPEGVEVRIVATNVYKSKEDYVKAGYPIESLESHRPLCVGADGLPVCDDTGGIGGYCYKLRTLHGKDEYEKHTIRNWFKKMGWTGRYIKPENIL